MKWFQACRGKTKKVDDEVEQVFESRKLKKTPGKRTTYVRFKRDSQQPEIGPEINERVKWAANNRAPTHCTSDYMKIAQKMMQTVNTVLRRVRFLNRRRQQWVRRISRSRAMRTARTSMRTVARSSTCLCSTPKRKESATERPCWNLWALTLTRTSFMISSVFK